MALTTTGYQHIGLDEKGIPIIEDTTTKVEELIVENMAWGWGPEEIYTQHPYLSLGQIYSAFAYYHDHKAEIDQDIERREEYVEKARMEAGPSPLVAKLKAKGLL